MASGGVATYEVPVSLDAQIRVVHGNELVTEMAIGGSFAELGDQFAAWIDR